MSKETFKKYEEFRKERPMSEISYILYAGEVVFNASLKQETTCLITKKSENSCCCRLQVRGKWWTEAWRS